MNHYYFNIFLSTCPGREHMHEYMIQVDCYYILLNVHLVLNVYNGTDMFWLIINQYLILKTSYTHLQIR